eukprot:TRINITY_DN6050_c0_g2_i2.p1 TRINITY_DN6050_c0_g2~~TRINITY_DN6050_c0_g2_i2.p1  ORF type:complete len:100 (-),score=1.29 TRINITY_DN6050_c0_g2_i2:50-349(-)
MCGASSCERAKFTTTRPKFSFYPKDKVDLDSKRLALNLALSSYMWSEVPKEALRPTLRLKKLGSLYAGPSVSLLLLLRGPSFPVKEQGSLLRGPSVPST